MSSAAEAKLGMLYINAREAVPCQTFLNKLGHTQTPTPIERDNSTTLGVVTNNILPRRTKAIDMRYWWLCDHDNQETSYITGALAQPIAATTSQSITALPTIRRTTRHI
jgi:hypothetical protein